MVSIEIHVDGRRMARVSRDAFRPFQDGVIQWGEEQQWSDGRPEPAEGWHWLGDDVDGAKLYWRPLPFHTDAVWRWGT